MSDNFIKKTGEKLKKISYPQGAVGNHITTKVPIIFPNQSIVDVVYLLHEFSKTCVSINYLYVLNDNKKLVGVVSIKEILGNKKHELIKEIMNRNVVVSHVQVNKIRVARLSIKHSIKAVPVLFENEKFAGVLTSNKMLAIINKDYRKYIYRNAGLYPIKGNFEDLINQSVWRTFVSRLPWILVGLIGGVFSAQIIQSFQVALSQNIVLAAFIPLIVYVGNAVGAQTQVLFVRDWQFTPKMNLVSYTLKQLVTSSLIGTVCGLFIWSLVSIFWYSNATGMVIGLAAFTTITVSTFFAILIPYLFSIFKKDPTTGSGPFSTILQDLLSILVYFLIVSVLM